MKRYFGTLANALGGYDYDYIIDLAQCERDAARLKLDMTAKQLEVEKEIHDCCKATLKGVMKDRDQRAKECDELNTQLRRSDDLRSKLIDECDALSQALNKANVDLYTASQERDAIKQQLDNLRSSIKQLIS